MSNFLGKPLTVPSPNTNYLLSKGKASSFHLHTYPRYNPPHEIMVDLARSVYTYIYPGVNEY